MNDQLMYDPSFSLITVQITFIFIYRICPNSICALARVRLHLRVRELSLKKKWLKKKKKKKFKKKKKKNVFAFASFRKLYLYYKLCVQAFGVNVLVISLSYKCQCILIPLLIQLMK